MILLLALTTGALFAAGIYMLLRRSLVKILIGLLLLGYAVNLLLFNSGSRLVPGNPPLIRAGESAPAPLHADPVPQALILTAIVINFGVTAFAIVLIRQAYHTSGTDDLNQLLCTDLPCPPSDILPEQTKEEP
jgi:multicomponent Na+:H+ antiporter subunit C